MSTNPSTFGPIRAPIVDKNGMPSWAFLKELQAWKVKLDTALTLLGEIASTAIIQGRTEGIGTTVGKLTAAGLLEDTDQIAADAAATPFPPQVQFLSSSSPIGLIFCVLLANGLDLVVYRTKDRKFAGIGV